MTIREAAAAVAASRCLAARIRDPGRWLTAAHPSRCGWCDYPQPLLVEMVDEFHRWSGWSERRRTYDRHELRVWADLSARAQGDQVTAAQELEDEPPPAPARLADLAIAASRSVALPVQALEPEAEPDPPPAVPAEPPAAATSRPTWFGGPS